MPYLAIRTDRDAAMVAIVDQAKVLAQKDWTPGRSLSASLLSSIEEVRSEASISQLDLKGVIVFKGPGSFTSLRIGITVANTVAQSLGVPAVGVSGETWINQGAQKLADGADKAIVLPEYGAEPNITKQKK